MAIARPRIGQPPSGVTGELRSYLVQMTDALNQIPVASYFSGLSPNSVVTGFPGDLAINVGSASTQSRLWINAGTGFSNTGWVTVRILA